MGVSNPLIVTDRGSAGLPFIAELQRTLVEADIQSQIFADVAPNPLDSDIKVARQVFREGAHDAVVAIGGGGSGMDAGKATALTANNDADIWQFDFDREAPALADEHEFPPLICIPTTAGTGAETESGDDHAHRARDEAMRMRRRPQTVVNTVGSHDYGGIAGEPHCVDRG